MVVMMDGTDTELGPQVATALFGYMIGVTSSVACFYFGRIVAEWLKEIHASSRYPVSSNEETLTLDDAADQSRDECKEKVSLAGCRLNSIVPVIFSVRFSLLLSMIFVASYVAGDLLAGLNFYRKMWMTILLTPFGAIIRWRLSAWNSRGVSWWHLEWFPLGTFLCNVQASIVAIVVKAFEGKRASINTDENRLWIEPFLAAVGAGFSGSLSTVSTMIKEMALLSNPSREHGYCTSTILCSLIICLLLYRPIRNSSS
jgi:fluoride ion exporter CrcB/FEX